MRPFARASRCQLRARSQTPGRRYRAPGQAYRRPGSACRTYRCSAQYEHHSWRENSDKDACSRKTTAIHDLQSSIRAVRVAHRSLSGLVLGVGVSAQQSYAGGLAPQSLGGFPISHRSLLFRADRGPGGWQDRQSSENRREFWRRCYSRRLAVSTPLAPAVVSLSIDDPSASCRTSSCLLHCSPRRQST